MDLTALKEKLILLTKNHYSHYVIFPVYDENKQRNLQREGGADFTTMETFIDGKRTDIDNIETDINALTDTLVLDNWNKDAPGDMAAKRTYIATYCTGITKDEQKDMVASALQALTLGR